MEIWKTLLVIRLRNEIIETFLITLKLFVASKVNYLFTINIFDNVLYQKKGCCFKQNFTVSQFDK